MSFSVFFVYYAAWLDIWNVYGKLWYWNFFRFQCVCVSHKVMIASSWPQYVVQDTSWLHLTNRNWDIHSGWVGETLLVFDSNSIFFYHPHFGIKHWCHSLVRSLNRGLISILQLNSQWQVDLDRLYRNSIFRKSICYQAQPCSSYRFQPPKSWLHPSWQPVMTTRVMTASCMGW